jgi:hypothetical protein
MAILNKGTTYASGDNVTAANLNALVDSATFKTGSNEATDNSTLQVHGSGYLKIKDLGVGSTQLADDAVITAKIADSTGTTDGVTSAKLATDSVIEAKIADNAVTTAKIKDSTGASDGVTTSKLATDAVTSAKISSTDTTFKVSSSDVVINDAGADVDFRVEGDTDANLLVCDATNDTIGIGGAPGSTFKLNVDGGSGKDTIYAKGNQASAYVDLKLENENASGNGGRVRISQGNNTASLQYQESGERVTLNIEDGDLSANAGITIACSSASQASLKPTGSMLSGTNSNVNLGDSSNTWDNGYIAAGIWTGSDRNLKQDIEDLSEAELRVATSLKSMMKKFRLKDAVVKKGDDARIHVGVIAQDVKAAFEAEGLDAYRYAILGEDTWWSKQNENGEWLFEKTETEGFTKHTKMSVRYEQLLSFIISAL